MSLKVMSDIWAYSRCSGTELLTLLALGDWADDDGWCWPSLAKLAGKARVQVSGICKLLTSIEQSGELFRERSTGGRNRRTRYRVSVNCIPQDTVSSAKQCPTKQCPTGHSVLENTVPQDTRTVSHRTHALIRHRSINQKNKSPNQSKKPDSVEPEDFTKFYEDYPNHANRLKAAQAWRKINPDDALLLLILEAVKNQKRWRVEKLEADPKAWVPEWPHPATWLNNARWTDELEVAKPASNWFAEAKARKAAGL